MSISATMVASNQFKVTGDKEEEFPAGRAVKLVQGADGTDKVYVTAVSYSGATGYTTVTVDDATVTSNLATIKLGPTGGGNDNQHPHTSRETGGIIAAASFTSAQVAALQTIDVPTSGDQYEMIRVNSSEDEYEQFDLVGTSNQVSVTHSAGTCTLALPQSIHTSATPTFYDLVLTSLNGVLVSSGASGVAGSGALKHLDDVADAVTDSAADGDILYSSSGDYTRLAAGTDGHVLHLASGVPAWSELDGDTVDIDYTPTGYTPDATPAEADDVDDLAAHLYGIDTALQGKAAIDGDVLDITFTPSNYTPDATPAQASDTGDLTAHLYGIDVEIGTLNTAPPSHASTHIDGAADAIDGDKIEITYSPTYYTPVTTPAEVDAADQLTAHLYAIDQGLNVAGGGAHAAQHIDGGSDEIDGDQIVITWTPTNYTRDSSTPSESDADDQLTAHLQGIDTALSSAGGGATADWIPPALKWKDADEIYVPAGKYYRGGYRHSGQYQDLSGLTSVWTVASQLTIDVTSTYSSGSSSGTIDGALVSGSWYGVWLLGNSANDVLLLPFFQIGAVDYDTSNTGKTTITFVDSLSSSSDGWPVTSSWSTDYQGYSTRTVIPVSSDLGSGDQIRVTIKSNSSSYPLYADNVAIVERSGSTEDGTTTPTEITFSGGSGVTLTGTGEETTSDWITFDFDPTKEYLLIIDHAAGSASYLSRSSTSGTTYVSSAAADTYNTAGMTEDDSPIAHDAMGIEDFEVSLSGEGYVESNDAWNSYRLLKYDTDATDGDVITIEDTVENASSSDEVIIDGDEVSTGAELAADDWLQLIPESTTDCVYLGAIRINSSGNVVEFRRDGWKCWYAEPVIVDGNEGTSVADTDISAGAPPSALSVSGNLFTDADEVYSCSVMAGLYSDTSATNPLVRARAVFGDMQDYDNQLVVPFSDFRLWQVASIANKFIYQAMDDGTATAAVNAEIQVSAFTE